MNICSSGCKKVPTKSRFYLKVLFFPPITTYFNTKSRWQNFVVQALTKTTHATGYIARFKCFKLGWSRNFTRKNGTHLNRNFVWKSEGKIGRHRANVWITIMHIIQPKFSRCSAFSHNFLNFALQLVCSAGQLSPSRREERSAGVWFSRKAESDGQTNKLCGVSTVEVVIVGACCNRVQLVIAVATELPLQKGIKWKKLWSNCHQQRMCEQQWSMKYGQWKTWNC